MKSEVADGKFGLYRWTSRIKIS